MNKFTIHCTPEQAEKALKLGAPLYKLSMSVEDSHLRGKSIRIEKFNKLIDYAIPTAEQMMGWLRFKYKITTWHIQYYPSADRYGYIVIGSSFVIELEGGYAYTSDLYDSNEKAILASIDAVLKYLIKNKE